MKLRQKLAVVLASAMVATAMPVVTMAASTNSLTRETLKVAKDAEFVELVTANALRVKFTSNTGTDETFYLDLENAEWNEDVLFAASQKSANNFVAYKSDDTVTTVQSEVAYYMYNGEVKYARQSNSSMKISIDRTKLTGTTDPVKNIPLFVKAKDGDAKVKIVNKGGTTVTEEVKVFATTAEKKINVSVENNKTFYTKGELSKIVLEEAYKGALKDGAQFAIELNDSDFYFDGSTVTLTGKYGFSAYGENKTFACTLNTSKDDGTLIVNLPSFVSAGIDPATAGTWEITGIKVKSTNKKPQEGDFTVNIVNSGSSDDLVAEKNDVKIAKVAQYGAYVKVKDDKVKEVKAGRIEEVEFEVGENVVDSMTAGRDFEITLENAEFNYKKLVNKAFEDGKLTTKASDLKDGKLKVKADFGDVEDFEDYMKELALKIDAKWLAGQLIDNKGDWDMTTLSAEFDQDNDDKAVPSELTITVGEAKDTDKCRKLEFKTDICVSIADKEAEKATIKVAGRALDGEASTELVKIINPFNVTFEQAVLKTGLQGQVAGKVTLTEADKDMFQKGDMRFRITKNDEEYGIYLTDVKVEVSNGLKGTNTEVTKGNSKGQAKVDITLNRVSKEAATITLGDMTFTTDRTVPEGTYDLEISGTAIDANDKTIVVKDFIKIGTANTEDLVGSNGLAKGISTFVIGESKYTVNGVEKTMDAASYIKDPGFTMVPVRFVAEAFGVTGENILFGKGTVTIFAGNRTIQLTNGSNVAIVNGAPVSMATAVEIKEGRTYAPIGEIATILGVSKDWNAGTKTATFENK